MGDRTVLLSHTATYRSRLTIGTIISTFALAVFAIRTALPRLARRWNEFELLLYAIGFSGAALLLFPLFRDPYLLAAASFVLGLGCGVGQPMSMSLIYSLSPSGRASEGAALRVMFNHATHLIVPIAFGGLVPYSASGRCSSRLRVSRRQLYGLLSERKSARPAAP